MSQLRRYVRQVRASRQHVTRPAVPQVVRGSPPDFCNVLNLVPDPPQEFLIPSVC